LILENDDSWMDETSDESEMILEENDLYL